MKFIKFLLLATATVLTLSANAQEVKKTVLGVESFTCSADFSQSDAEMVRNQIISAIRKTGRVIVVDNSSATSDVLNKEAERRKRESAMDANTVKDMSSLNANSLLSVSLDQLAVTKEVYEDYEYVKGSDGKTRKQVKGRYPYLKATITYTVKITDCEKGAVQAQETYSYSDGSYNTLDNKAEYETADAARDGILRHCVSEDAFKLLILNTFKTQGKIIQVDETNGKKAKTVYINLGSENGIEKKQYLEVYKEVDVAGEISKKLIGEVEVQEVMGPSRCLAKVKKGGEDIQQVLNAGGNLPVQTREVKQRGFLGLGGIK